MELILIAGVIAALLLLRKQNQRLKVLEADFAALRAGLARADIALAAPEPARSSGTEDAPELPTSPGPAASGFEDEAEPDTADTAPGPWQVAAARAERPEPESEPVLARAPAARRPDIETALGTRWTVWVGGLALALGGLFLVRYSIEAGIFGPRVRLVGATLFGLLLAAVGEMARRRGFKAPVAGVSGAYIPAILTAAAAATLFGATFAAHGVYGFIGPAAAFAILGALGLATIAAALLHGQALAGLGLLGSFVTPLLVTSQSPDDRALFVYLTIVLAATVAVAAIRRWRALAASAYVGAGLWSLAYLVATGDPSPALVSTLQLVGIAALAGLWLARRNGEEEDVLDPAALCAAIFALFVAVEPTLSFDAPMWSALLILAMLAAAAWRGAALALLHTAGIAVLAIQAWPFLHALVVIDLFHGSGLVIDGEWPATGGFTRLAMGLSLVFLAGGVAMAHRIVAIDAPRAASFAFWAAAAPLATLVASWLTLGNPHIDWRYAAPAFALAALLAAAAELVSRAENDAQTRAGGLAVSFLVGGAAAALALALLAGFGPVLTTILTGLAAAVPAAATRWRPWPALGWASAGLAAVTLVRVGIDPTIAGPEFLSTTPFLNALTPGYFIPAAAFAFTAWQLARTTAGRPRLAMEAFAPLFALVGAAMLTRHAMNGGVIDGSEPRLAEQAIHSLLLIGGGAVLLALDRRSPSPVFRLGSMALGVISVLTIASAHFFGLNPLVSNESTGAIPVLNLLLLAYLMPAAAMAALAWRARGIRPGWYVSMLAVCAGVLAFAYVTLSVRRVFQGEFIGAWKGMGEIETYSYSAVWLAIGVAMLVAGLRYRIRTLRMASAALVVAAVAKVFLYDMRQLEGPLRALSFIGLGGVLIGIGMFYQKMLMPVREDEAGPEKPA